MKPGDIILAGVRSQGFISRAIKLGSILRYQPTVARAATVAQAALVVLAVVLAVLLGWSLLAAAASVVAAAILGVPAVWVVAAVGGDHSAPWARYSHAALVTQGGQVVDGIALGVKLTEALKQGVVPRAFHYPKGTWTHIPVDLSDWDRRQVLAKAKSVEDAKQRYGKVVFASLFVYCVTASLTWLPTLVLFQSGTAICSGFVCDALAGQGPGPIIWQREPVFMMPSDIAAYFGVK